MSSLQSAVDNSYFFRVKVSYQSVNNCPGSPSGYHGVVSPVQRSMRTPRAGLGNAHSPPPKSLLPLQASPLRILARLPVRPQRCPLPGDALFVAALFAKGFTHDLLLEAAIFLVSVKLIMLSYRNSKGVEDIQHKLDKILSEEKYLEKVLIDIKKKQEAEKILSETESQ